jgi:hypothetical protein
VGVNKIKFTVYAGLMIALAAAIGLAALQLGVQWAAARFKLGRVLEYSPYVFAALMLCIALVHAAGPTPYAKLFLIKSFEPRYQDDPLAMAPKAAKLCEELRAKGVPAEQIQMICAAGSDPQFASTIGSQFNGDVCWLSQMKIDELFPTEANQKNAAEAAASARFRCNRLGTYWVDSMDWISKNLGPGDRVTSWWDYGHWINYFGDRKTVLRNEHASRGMIGEIAYSYIVGTPQDLAKAMNYFDSRYALFDMELITSGSSFGGKYGALNYLGCVHAGKTALLQQPGTSDCEFEHSPERILISKVQLPQTICTISESQKRNGLLAYAVGKSGPVQANILRRRGHASGRPLNIRDLLP